MAQSEFDTWQYIVDNLPDYDWRQDVALSNDLDKYLAGEFGDDDWDRERVARIEAEYGDYDQVQEYAHYLDAKLYIEAYEAAHEGNLKPLPE